MSRRLLTLAALAAVAAVAACGPAAAEPTPPPAGMDLPLHRALALMPDVEQSRQYLRLANISELAAYLGETPPSDSAPRDDLNRYKAELMLAAFQELHLGLFGDGEWLSGFPRDYINSMPDTHHALGFDTRNIDMILVTGESQPRPSPVIEILLGRIDPGRAADALEACGECVPHEAVTHAGVEYHSWGSDFQQSLRDRMALPAHDHLGRGGRIFVGDGHATRTLRTHDMEAVIDAATGARPSLLDRDEWRLTAGALTGFAPLLVTATPANVPHEHGAQLLVGWPAIPPAVEDGGPVPPSPDPALQEWLDQYPELGTTIRESSAELPSHLLAMTAAVRGESGVEVAMALVYESEETAEQAAEALRDRAVSGLYDGLLDGLLQWDDAIAETEFTAQGRVVVGKVRPASPEYLALFMIPTQTMPGALLNEHALAPQFLLQ